MNHKHITISKISALLLLVLLVFTGSMVNAGPLPNPDVGPGGPILIIKPSSPEAPSLGFERFYPEVLRNEGFNAFSVVDLGTVTATPTILNNYQVVILSQMPLSTSQATMFTDWVTAGGNLIAMRPDTKLASLLGLNTPSSGTLSGGYLLVDTTQPPGKGIVGQTIQFHGDADRYTLNGATKLATLYTDASTATSNPAVTLRSVGSNGGQAAAFTYDLAKSIVYTRQGNPAWAAQERDGFTPIRSDDKFYGDASGDPEPDWVDLNKVAIPQADEQQRLLANLIIRMNLDKMPLPHFWYFPRGERAVVIMTGDDHAQSVNGTSGRFDQFIASSPPGCTVENWECIRGTSYIWFNPQYLTDAQAKDYTDQGFEVGLHINTDCQDYTPTSLLTTYSEQVAAFTAAYPSIPVPVTQRHHCIVWSDWVTGAKTELAFGMRLDTSYYFWPPAWADDVPGLFTGSGMPMRFADTDGSLIDVYQATSQMTDESGQSYPMTIDTLLDRALGQEGYYGAFTINAHTDFAQIPEADAVVTSALARGVPIVSSKQMMDWLDGRNSSSFESLAWDGHSLSFNVSADPNANGLETLVPMQSSGGILTSVTRDGSTVPFTADLVKGIDYARFSTSSGAYVATYAVDTASPTVISTPPAGGAINTDLSTNVSVVFSEAMDASTINASTFELRDTADTLVSATVQYDAATHTATLKPNGPLTPSAAYTVIVKGGLVKDLAGNPLTADVTWSFTMCACSSVWSNSTTPAIPSEPDTDSVELGVRFRTDQDGYITGIRFYKGIGNTGTHVGNLWTSTGQLLGSATFTNETTTGWQQVNFATPVAVTANTVYIASYFAPSGHYAADGFYFENSGVDNGPIHLLKDGVSGDNGVYAYSASSTFPNSTTQSTNYWVDMVFSANTGLTVTSTSPTNLATGVNPGTIVSAGFNSALDVTTINASNFFLKDASNALVPASLGASGTTATLTPTSPLASSTTYTATLTTSVKDSNGNALAGDYTWSFTTAAGTGGCGSPPNPIVAENCLPGNPSSEWDISGAGDTSIQGFATNISVNQGDTINFKIKTNANPYQLDIYRMGYYGGNGARKITTINPSASLPQTQPACLTDATGLIDCGNWSVSASWAVPSNATSGIYFARLVRSDTGGASHIFFIVRDDASHSDILFQTSDTSWQAYNDYGGNNLYTGNGALGRAYKVSYNRPFNTRVYEPESWVFNGEYPMVRWLEANGYDVSYFTGVDADRYGELIKNHKIFMSNGHDEYWSGDQRSNVEAARDAGVNLTFFSGNAIFWKTRWENAIDVSGTPYRTLVCYKETHANAVIDPQDPTTWTGTWRDPRFSPPADGGRPENTLTGTLFRINGPFNGAITVPQAEGRMRFWRDTSVASLGSGQVATLAPGTVGAEVDVDEDNGFRPAGLIGLSNLPITTSVDYLQDYGSTYGAGTTTHKLTLYKAPSGALVFSTGSYQWSWGLDNNHDRSSLGSTTDVRMKQATINLFADMNVQPASLQAGLVAAIPSSDATEPASTITSPAAGSDLPPGNPVTITGTATDTGGGIVGGVEVSVDGGVSWHPAIGRENWSYLWTPTRLDYRSQSRVAQWMTAAILKRRVPVLPSRSGGGGTICTINCSIWSNTALPGYASRSRHGAVELGVKFRADVDGTITGVRFYKISCQYRAARR